MTEKGGLYWKILYWWSIYNKKVNTRHVPITYYLQDDKVEGIIGPVYERELVKTN